MHFETKRCTKKKGTKNDEKSFVDIFLKIVTKNQRTKPRIDQITFLSFDTPKNWRTFDFFLSIMHFSRACTTCLLVNLNMRKMSRISPGTFKKLLGSSKTNHTDFCLKLLRFKRLRNTLVMRYVVLFDPSKTCFCRNIESKVSGMYQKSFPIYQVPKLCENQFLVPYLKQWDLEARFSEVSRIFKMYYRPFSVWSFGNTISPNKS